MGFPFSFTWSFGTTTGGVGASAVSGGVLAADLAGEYGFDVLTIPDLDGTMTPRQDAVVVADAIARRLITPLGKLLDHPNYGFDLRDFLNDELDRTTLQTIRAGVEAQAEQDERVFNATAVVKFDPNTETLSVSMQCEGAEGPFNFVLAVTELTAQLFVEA